ncbi:dTDP-4-dehydrorhamnose reductase [Devosia sp. 2618]|uniref:dTDP-4-dehydrorhamnose reductase n=1 Tax=Devosia sp. 2618 TaxID=3156454 RepID=UPI003390D0AC
MKILIVGGTGQVGRDLQRALEPLGDIMAPSRAHLDLADPNSIAQVWEQYRPDAVVNAGAYTAVDDAEAHSDHADAINHRAVDILAQLVERHHGWLVHYSTDYVFNGQGAEPFDESAPKAPLNIYGRSKLAGDEAIVASGCRHLILRTSWVHAPRGRNFVSTILKLAADRDHLRVVADQHGAPTSAALIADVTAIALRRALANDEISGTYHVTAAGETSWHEVAQFAVTVARKRGAVLTLRPEAIDAIGTADYPLPAARPLNSRLDTTRFRHTFDVALPDWHDGVERTVAGLVAA